MNALQFLGFGGPQGPEWIIIFLMLGLVGLWVWSLIHCIRNRMLSDSNRIIGIVLIVVLGVIGSAVYLALPRENEPQR
ncbi:hypothetical protein [Haloferula sp. A504]|uniref:hypothetical protein n=1 Tax=Haloferula sp. A504 TaxID=3373601 RepID=UPI0031C993E9|nr:PLDc N-terminal domain-containing protein [Verrucomicrobiaceae bacterium E54]